MGRKPDIDKLIRATLDGFTDARLWVDDALVDCVVLRKLYQGTQVPVGVNVVVEWEGAAI
jgi:Holliday junction resolvase RusA-like endonuclease